MRDVLRTVIVVLTLCFLLIGPALAFMPTEWGVSAPQTIWSDRGIKGTVSGKVVTSLDQTKGAEGAYVALVDPMNQWKEYSNTTTDADGNYRFTGVNATYSSVLYKGPDGSSGSYQQGLNVYMIYANISTDDGYSSTFGVDTNRSNTVIDPIVVYAGIPDAGDIATPTPEPTPQPTAVVTPTPATATPEPTPGPTGQLPGGLLLAAAALIILAIAAIAAYFLFLRKK